MSTVKTLFKVNLILGLATLIGFLNNIIIAGVFGLSRTLDAYFAASLIPNFFIILFIDYLGKNFLPVFSVLSKNGKAEASNLTSSVINIVFIFSVLITFVLILLSEKIFTLILPGFDQNSINKVVIMFWIISPTITIRAINQFHEYVWQYNERYERVAVSNILPSIGILMTLLIGKDYLGVYSLPVGFLISHLAMLILLATGVGYRYRFYLTFKDKYIKQIFFNSGIMVTSGLITKFRSIIQHYFSSKLEAGAISALSIADRICLPLHQRATVGIKMVVFTRSAKAVAAGETSDFGKLYNITMIVISLLMVPITTWIGLNSEIIIRVLFMRGQFTEEMNFLVSLALIGLIPSVVFLSMIPILLNAFYVLDKIYVPALVGPAATIVYVVALWQLTQKYGVLGVAISTSIMAFFQFIILVIILNKNIEVFSLSMILLKFLLYVLLSGIAFGTSAFFTHHIYIYETIELFFTLFAGFFIYFALLWVFKEKGFQYTKRQVLSLVKKYT